MDLSETAVPPLVIEFPLARQMLARLSPPAEPLRIGTLKGGGHSGAIVFVDVAGGGRLVIKFYPREPPRRMAREFTVARLLMGYASILAPRFLLADESCALTPYRYSIMTRLPGEPLAQCERRMTETELLAVWRQIGTQMRHIHGIPMEGFGAAATGQLAGRVDRNRDYMDAIWRDKIAQFRKLGGDPALALAMERSWSDRSALLDFCQAPRLCHYDIHPGNLLAERANHGWKLSGVLDFELAFAGDPLLDLAKCAHFARAGSGARWRGLIEGYGAIENSKWEETIELYRLYLALEYWDWIAFLGRPQDERDDVAASLRRIVARL